MTKTLTTKPLLAPIRARAKEPRAGLRRANEMHLEAANIVHAASLAGTDAGPLFGDMQTFAGSFSFAPSCAPAARPVDDEDTGAHVVAEWAAAHRELTLAQVRMRGWLGRNRTDLMEAEFATILALEAQVARLSPLLP